MWGWIHTRHGSTAEQKPLPFGAFVNQRWEDKMDNMEFFFLGVPPQELLHIRCECSLNLLVCLTNPYLPPLAILFDTKCYKNGFLKTWKAKQQKQINLLTAL